jgi:HrpA-like RNA helicase
VEHNVSTPLFYSLWFVSICTQSNPQPPNPLAVRAAVRALVRLQALRIVSRHAASDSSSASSSSASSSSSSLSSSSAAASDTEELTALGFHLSTLPVDVRVGKMILFGAMFGCLDAVLTIAAMLRYVLE